MTNEAKKTPIDLKVGSIWDPPDREYAAGIIAEGGIVGVFNRGVNALWINGHTSEAVTALQAVKGETRGGRPVALTIGFDRLIEMIDSDVLTDDVRRFLMVTEDIKYYLGSLCFLRVPLKSEYAGKVPASSLSTDAQGRFWIQTWDPFGHEPTEDLIRNAEGLGIEFPAVTSMNISGQPEIVDQDEGEAFCRSNGIPVYLRDSRIHDKIQGSYTIVTLGEKGVELVRDGNIPGRMLQPIFNLPMHIENTILPKYPQMEFPRALIEGLSPRAVRLAILLYIKGGDPQKINQRLARHKFN